MTSRLLLTSCFLFFIGCTTSPSIQQVSEAVVELKMSKAPAQTLFGPVPQPQAVASGFFISNDGLIMTAAHCVRGFSKIEVVRGEKTYRAKVLLVSKTADVALIKIALSDTPFLKFAENGVKAGDVVQAIGSPLGITNTYVRGYVAGDWGDGTLLDLTMLPGYSGCPILNEWNKVIGVGSKYVTLNQAATHLGIAVSLDVIKDFMEEFIFIPFKGL